MTTKKVDDGANAVELTDQELDGAIGAGGIAPPINKVAHNVGSMVGTAIKAAKDAASTVKAVGVQATNSFVNAANNAMNGGDGPTGDSTDTGGSSGGSGGGSTGSGSS